MDHTRAFETPGNRMHVFSIGLCIITLVTSGWVVIATIPMNLVSLLLIGSQVGVYAVIALFAWLCRKHTVASVVVTLMALIAIGLGATMLYFLLALVSAPSVGVSFFLGAPIFGQIIVGFFGCYIGYAIVEWQAMSVHQKDSARGKLLVIFIAAVATGLVAFLWVFVA